MGPAVGYNAVTVPPATYASRAMVGGLAVGVALRRLQTLGLEHAARPPGKRV